MSLLAQVAVEKAAYHFDKLFTYSVPEGLAGKVAPGVRVLVPFGPGGGERVGMVFALGGEEAANLKPIQQVLDESPLLEQGMLDLAQWLKDRTFCTLFEAVRLMVPAGMQLRLQSSYVLAPGFKDFDREMYTDTAWQVLQVLRRSPRAVPFEKLQKGLGIAEDDPGFQSLLSGGAVCRVNLAASRLKDAVAKMVRLVPGFEGKLTPRQREVYATLQDVGEASEKELCYFTGASPAVVRALAEKGAAEVFEYEVYRRPASSGLGASSPLEGDLSPSQQQALAGLLECYVQAQAGSPKNCALLYGVTGSGKTSVYLRLIAHVLEEGRSALVLVPEISLTAQALGQFQGAFGGQVAVLHSGLSLGERMDEWKRIRRGEAKVVVGTRSAVFAPVADLGLVVIDEEQEPAYKAEASPRFDAREVARRRCTQSRALCLLASATPSVEACYMARQKKYAFFKLEGRFGPAQIPTVELVDQNQEAPHGDEAAIGPTLAAALKENFQAGRQSIVLLNRRGYHTFASCPSCHEVLRCPHCSISLTFHSANRRLMCHYCGYSVPLPDTCPACGKPGLRYRGSGTQRAEEQLQGLLPDAKVLRLDTDAVAARYSLERRLEEFAKGEYHVMVGTQMVAKGLDFENVTLVGVLSADQSLYSDDFRSAERTFDLLTQVVGRAGRGRYPGRAIIQTYMPENPVLHLAGKQDYFGFFKRELLYRKALLYPPFADLLVVGFVGTQESLVEAASGRFLTLFTGLAAQEYPTLPLRVLRPTPAAIARVGGKYRYKLIIKCRSTPPLRQLAARTLTAFAALKDFRTVTAYPDPDPNYIL